MTKKKPIDINELGALMFSGGDDRYTAWIGDVYYTLLKIFALLQKDVLTCQRKIFLKLPILTNEEQEYLDNVLKYSRSTHDPETARDVIQLIWCTQKHLPICKSYEKYIQWREVEKALPLYRVMIEPRYPAGRADVGLVLHEKGKDYPRVIIAAEIGDTRVDKPIEAFRGPTNELWIFPYQEWGKVVQKRIYYVFKRGVNWNKPWKVNKQQILSILNDFKLDENLKTHLKNSILRSFPEQYVINELWLTYKLENKNNG
jgi:hypothetical protein